MQESSDRSLRAGDECQAAELQPGDQFRMIGGTLTWTLEQWFDTVTPDALRVGIESELSVRCIVVPTVRGHVHVFYHGDETPEVVRAIAREHAPAGLSFSAHPVLQLFTSEVQAQHKLRFYAPLYWITLAILVAAIVFSRLFK